METAQLKTLAAQVGFSDCGVARADALSEEEFPLGLWLSKGCHADMGYMQRNSDKRVDPRILVPGANSVVSLILSYKPDRIVDSPVRVSQYAYCEDYHTKLKQMMFRLMELLANHDSSFSGRCFVDTAPISDRHWAVRAGLGWLGRNTMFFHPRFGSWCFLGEIVTDTVFDSYDRPIPFSLHPCENCTICVDSCPNHAIIELTSQDGSNNDSHFIVDANRCTSYNTIENRSPELPPFLDTRGYVYGCDICQIVCPYNKDVKPSMTVASEFESRLSKLYEATEEEFPSLVSGSAMDRISFSQWQRNLKSVCVEK